MHYQDFILDIGSAARKGRFEARVADAPIRDRPRITFPPPIDRPTLEAIHASFDRPTAEASPGAAPHTPPLTEDEVRELGRRLHAALFGGKLGALFQRCRDVVPANGQHGVRVRLRFRLDDPEAEYLAALSWEWLADAESGELVAIDRATPVVRDLATRHPYATLEVQGPLRILVVAAAPREKGLIHLDLEREVRHLKEVLKRLTDRRRVELHRLRPVAPDTLRDALRDKGIHVLHFMGHAGYHPGSGNGALFFVTADGSGDRVDGEKFASYLKGIKSLRLVVLNACKTARLAGRLGAPLNHGVASAILERTGIPAVVATQYSISDPAAVEFSRLFYSRIARAEPVDTALTEVRLRLLRHSHEWATPVLFLNGRDGRLFSFTRARTRRLPPSPRRAATPVPAAAGTVRHAARTAAAAAAQVRLGVRSRIGIGGDMEERTDRVLDLTRYFDDRFIKRPAWWQEKVFPELRTFLQKRVDPHRPLLLDFAAHSSIAFAAGWLLESKRGLEVAVRQRVSGKGEFEWHPARGVVPREALWQERPDVEISPAAPDVAVAVSVSQEDVAGHVRTFVQRKRLPVGRIVDAVIAPRPGQTSVEEGAHALALAEALITRLRMRYPHEREGVLHLFCAAPNALVFYLGQLSRSLEKVVLYEHPMGTKGAYGHYQRSIELPPPGEAAPPPDWEEW